MAHYLVISLLITGVMMQSALENTNILITCIVIFIFALSFMIADG